MRIRGKRLRSAVMGGLTLALFGAVAEMASADAIVSASTSTLSVSAQALAGADGNFEMRIEPVSSASMSVGQLRFGDPTITTSDSHCTRDFFGNTVTCAPGSFAFSSLNVKMGDGADNVQYANAPDVVLGCVAFSVPPPTIALSADLGAGNDTFSTVDNTLQCPNGTLPADTSDDFSTFDPILTVDGGTGNDTISGAQLSDTLRGGIGDDILRGEDGADLLQGGPGNDQLDGGGAIDTLFGGTGNDTLKGGTGNDLFQMDSTDGSDGADSFSGGPGFDTVNYAPRTCALTVTVGNGSADDGCAGEHDNVIDAEHILGGSAGDNITGSAASETIDGGPGQDLINGGPGTDILNGGADEDTIFAVDGEPDNVSCGAGNDVAVLDLKDSVATTFIRLPSGATFPIADCESVTRQAVDDSKPGRPLARAVRLVHGAAIVQFRCPTASKPACRGRLTVRDLYKSQRTLGSVRYSLRLGTTRAISVPLSRAAITELRRSGHALVQTVEHGHSKKGPRGAAFQLHVAG